MITGIIGLAGYQAIVINKLSRQVADTAFLLNDLAFKQKEAANFIETQAARIHFDILKRLEQLEFYPDMPLQKALDRPGARELLIRFKMIRKKDEGPFDETLAQRARKYQLSLEPILVILNDLEVSK